MTEAMMDSRSEEAPKHTPGPWFAGFDSIFGIWNLTYPKPFGRILVQASGYSTHINLRPEDWKLIAAAPEMLEALKYLTKEVDSCVNNAWLCKQAKYKEAQAAIAKAEGRQP